MVETIHLNSQVKMDNNLKSQDKTGKLHHNKIILKSQDKMGKSLNLVKAIDHQRELLDL